MGRLHTTQLLINSKDRENPNATNSTSFNYILEDLLLGKIVRWRVDKVSIPFSYYTIENQQFQLAENASSVHFPDLPSGTYTANELCAEIVNAIGLAGATGTYTCVYDNSTGKFTLSVNAPNDFALNWTNNNLPANKQYKSLGILMGFVSEFDFRDLPNANSHTSQFAANLSGPANLYVASNTLQSTYTSYFNKQKLSIIQEVPVVANRFEWIVWANPNKDFYEYDNRNIDSINLRLVDDHNQQIDLNGRDWTISIVCEHLSI